VGQARASQTITVPGQPGVSHVTLGLWYRVFTQDVVIGTDGKLYDSFDVYVDSELALRDGQVLPKSGCDSVADLGWRYGSYSLDAFVGQTVTITLVNQTRVDTYYNTYTYVDDVQVVAR
jgi:hypothetical protein